MALIVKLLFVFSFVAVLHSAPLDEQTSSTPANIKRQFGSTSGENPNVHLGSAYSQQSSTPVPYSRSTNRAVRDTQQQNLARTQQGQVPQTFQHDRTEENRQTTSTQTGNARRVRDTQESTTANIYGTSEDSRNPALLNAQHNSSPYSTLPTENQRHVRDTSSSTTESSSKSGEHQPHRIGAHPLSPEEVHRSARDTSSEKHSQRPSNIETKPLAKTPGQLTRPAPGVHPASGRTARDTHYNGPHDQHSASNVHPIPSKNGKRVNDDEDRSKTPQAHRQARDTTHSQDF